MLVACDLTQPPQWAPRRRDTIRLPGGIRCAEPRETLERVADIFRSLGVEYLRIDGNDDLGVPVYWAYNADLLRAGRPSLDWSYGGKGVTAELAEASVVMESIERSYASRVYHPTLVRGSPFELEARALHPERLCAAQPVDDASVQEWGWAVSLTTGAPTLIHANYLLTPYEPALGQQLFRAEYNGLASGNTVEEAVLHGLYELIERDAWVLAQVRATPAPAIDLEDVDDVECRRIIDALVARGVHLQCLDLGAGMPGLTLGLVAFDDGMPRRKMSMLVSGTSHDPTTALTRCLTELCQLRANELFIAEELPAPTDAGRNRRAAEQLFADAGFRVGDALPFSSLCPCDMPDHIDARIDHIAKALASRDVEVFVSRLASAPGRLDVVKLNARGLQPITGDIRYLGDADMGASFSRRHTARLDRAAGRAP